jgi:deoxyribodipyrimidine photo-lyase
MYDPKGEYIKKWVVELRDLPPEFIHEPHKLPKEEFEQLKYPMAVVENDSAMKQAVIAFKNAGITVQNGDSREFHIVETC